MNKLIYVDGIPFWRNVVVLQWVLQIISAIFVVSVVSFFLLNVTREINEREIPFGFDFIERAAQIPIGETVIQYDPSNSYLYALGVALLNTVKASVLGVILATMLGIIIGVARISNNWLLNRLALAYIETFRNVPLLLQLLFWFLIVLGLPHVRETFSLFNAFYLNNSGFYLPWPTPMGGFWAWTITTIIGITAASITYRFLSKREEDTGKPSYPIISWFIIAIGASTIAYIIFTPMDIVSPEAQGRFGRLAGGARLSGSFFALLLGLVIYTSSFIAEIVRAGIQSVRKGQTEAAKSLGLSPTGTLRHIIFPQAMRVIIPPLISQYLNLTKNSSLAVAIGFPDLVSVASTMTQTAPAISLIGLVMISYLAMSLTYSLIGNIYGRLTRYAGAD